MHQVPIVLRATCLKLTTCHGSESSTIFILRTEVCMLSPRTLVSCAIAEQRYIGVYILLRRIRQTRMRKV